ncbi:MAG: hypothetical protein ACUVX9_13010 [Anaerolineae bacterium]
MMYEQYLPAAFVHNPVEGDMRRGSPEIVLYNPAPEPCEAALTVYFTDRDPVVLKPVAIKPETNELIVFPRYAPDVLTDAGYIGLKCVSTTPLLLNLIDGVRLVVPEPQFRGGCTNFHGTKLDTIWRVPDGLWLEWNKQYNGDLSKAPFPFNEGEFYHFLNPNPVDVEMEMTIEYRRTPHEVRHIKIGAERVWVWDNLNDVHYCNGYAIRTRSSAPIAVQAVRYLYGLNGLHEWGLTVHCAMHGIPGPVEA